jgi:hypothetical protein
MSLSLPFFDSPVRELFDLQQLAALGANGFRDVPTFREALRAGRATLAAERAAKAVHLLALRADGELWLIKVTPGGWSRAWNFGRAVA